MGTTIAANAIQLPGVKSKRIKILPLSFEDHYAYVKVPPGCSFVNCGNP